MDSMKTVAGAALVVAAFLLALRGPGLPSDDSTLRGANSVVGPNAAEEPPSQPTFMWGVSTAGYQWEGGDITSNWAKFEKEKVEKNLDGVDGWNQYAVDIRNARAVGCNSFRTSIEWSRLFPQPGVLDQDALQHYDDVINCIRSNGMEPVITLLHFSYPHWIDAAGGWEKEGSKAPAAFGEYARFVAQHFKGRIRYYLTLNEPNTFLIGAYVTGDLAPGIRDIQAAERALRNVVDAHNAAYWAIKTADSGARVSTNLYVYSLDLAPRPSEPTKGVSDFIEPLKTYFDIVDVDAFLDAMEARTHIREPGNPKRLNLDYFALDYYCKLRAPWDFYTYPHQIGFPAHNRWEVYPQGLYDALDHYYRDTHHGYHLPMMVAENGFANYDKAARPDGETRAHYIESHVAKMKDAIATGVPVIGYSYWSITDNYEWGSYKPQFGLYRIDKETHLDPKSDRVVTKTFRRIPDEGAIAAYRKAIKESAL